MINNNENINNIDNDNNYNFSDNNLSEEEIPTKNILFSDEKFFSDYICLSYISTYEYNNINNINQNNLNINKKPKKIFLNKKTSHTKINIKNLLDLELSSYELNHTIKLIKSFWINGIYILLNSKLNSIIKKNLFKIKEFVFEFFYIKTSLIKTDNSEKNLKIFNINIKDLVTGNIENNLKDNDNNNAIKEINNIRLINFLNKINEDKKYQKNEEIMLFVREILFILEQNISYFTKSLWNEEGESNNKIKNEYKRICNIESLKNKFIKSKEIIKLIIKKIEIKYSIETENIKKEILIIKDGNTKQNYYNEKYFNKLIENNDTKLYVDEIIKKLLEISKKEKFELYFSQKQKKNKNDKKNNNLLDG